MFHFFHFLHIDIIIKVLVDNVYWEELMENKIAKASLIVLLLLTFIATAKSECNSGVPQTIENINIPSAKNVERCIKTFDELMEISYSIGKLVEFPETIQAIVLAETNGGKIRTPMVNKKSKKKQHWISFGVSQVHPNTAYFVLKDLLKVKNVPSKIELKQILNNDDVFSIHISTVYFKYLYDYYVDRGNASGVAWRLAVLAYNTGPGSISSSGFNHDPNNYVTKVRKRVEIARAYNSKR